MTFQEQMKASGVRVLQDNYVEWRMCQRKRRYDTEGAAQAAMHRTPPGGPVELNVYYCGHCFGWHVGHVITKGGAE